MKKLVEIDSLYSGSWGILEPYRDEIERGSYGAKERAYKRAILADFADIDEVAKSLGCCAGTASKRLKNSECRYILDGNKYLYFREDISALSKRANP